VGHATTKSNDGENKALMIEEELLEDDAIAIDEIELLHIHQRGN
jgi:hypothetical protein